MHPEQNVDDYEDLFNFLEYLNENWTNKRNFSSLAKNESVFSDQNKKKHIETYHSYDNELPVALIQLLIILLVFLIVLFMCKCNKIMRFCRDRKPKTDEELENERYHDKMRISDYLCFLWYNFKMRRRFKKRRIRRFNNNRNAIKFNKKGKLIDARQSSKNRDSSIFRRRSVRYRHRNNRNWETPEKRYTDSLSKRKKLAEKKLSVIIDLANNINTVNTIYCQNSISQNSKINEIV